MNKRFAILSALVLPANASAETVEPRRIYVIDGDTIALAGERQRIRLLDIDAPETSRPRCERERVLGLAAKARMIELLRAGPVTIDRHGTDRYRRALARLRVNGRDIGTIMMREGHAVRWKPGRKAWEEREQHWCGRK